MRKFSLHRVTLCSTNTSQFAQQMFSNRRSATMPGLAWLCTGVCGPFCEKAPLDQYLPVRSGGGWNSVLAEGVSVCLRLIRLYAGRACFKISTAFAMLGKCLAGV